MQLQVVDHELFAEKSQGNRVRIEPVPPIRGLIFDRNGNVIAENLPAYQLELIPEQVEDLEDTLNRLAAMDLIDREDIGRFMEMSRSGPRFKPVTLKLRLSEEEIANFAIQRPRFPGVDFRPRLVRHYPNGPEVAHAVGYVGALSTADLQRLDPGNRHDRIHILPAVAVKVTSSDQVIDEVPDNAFLSNDGYPSAKEERAPNSDTMRHLVHRRH